MTITNFLNFQPELVMLDGALVLFVITLGESRGKQAKAAALVISFAAIGACAFCLRQEGDLFSGAYRIDLFSQVLKVVFAQSRPEKEK